MSGVAEGSWLLSHQRIADLAGVCLRRLVGNIARLRKPEHGADCWELPVSAAMDLTTGRRMDTISAGSGWRSALDCCRCTKISEAIMNSILSMALVFGVCGLTGAADDKAVDPVGTWKCEYEIGGQQRTATLKVKKDGDNLTGTMAWPDQDDTKVKDLKLKDETLTFSAVRKLMGNEITVEYTLKIDGDKLKGKGAAEFGGEKQEFDIEGKREKSDK